jgi:hypothetical protein
MPKKQEIIKSAEVEDNGLQFKSDNSFVLESKLTYGNLRVLLELFTTTLAAKPEEATDESVALSIKFEK